jgi:hypothetical protein
MERILKVTKKDKIVHPLVDLADKHRYLYIVGKPGIGKTFTVKQCFPGAIYVAPEILKSKQTTIDFFERIAPTTNPVIIDDFDGVDDNIGIREISGPVSRGPLIIIGNKQPSLDGKPHVYEFPQMPVSEIMKLVSSPKTERAAIICQGDIRRFFQIVLFDSDDPDIFQTPKQVLESFVCKKGKENPVKYLGKYFEEHGNMMGLIQENYLRSPCVDPVHVTDCFSSADVIDKELYQGEWHLMSFFFSEGVIRPCISVGHTLDSLDPASLWTKELNIRMREKKIRTISTRNADAKFSHDELVLIGKYINNDIERAKQLVKEYKLESADIDVINHLHKLKTKNATIIKKQCQELTSTPKTTTRTLKS